MKIKPLVIAAVLVAVLALIGAGWLIHLALRPQPGDIPSGIGRQLNFTPYKLEPGDKLSIDPKSYKYDASQKVVSFVATSQASQLTISEQATPQSFIDIPDLYTKLVDNLNRYGVFNNELGTVYLTRPKDQRSGQTAVLNSKGVLMFVRSDRDLTDDQWRSVFQALTLEKN